MMPAVAAREPATRPRFALLDGLRGLAALAVLLLHLGYPPPLAIPHGLLAVDFFFLLSGFVIAHAYDARLTAGTMSVRDFAVTRLIRLYPMLLLGTCVGAAVMLARLSLTGEWHILTPWLEALLLGVVVLPTNVITLPGYGTAYPLNGPAWSLFFELTANAIYAAVATALSTGRLAVIVAVGAVGLITNIYTHDGIYGGIDWPSFAAGAWRVWFSFGAGVLLFRLRVAERVRARSVVAVCVAVALVAVLAAPEPSGWLYDTVCIVAVFPAIVVIGAGAVIGRCAEDLCLFAGRVSYPLYITHFPIVRIINHSARGHAVHGPGLLLALAAVPVLIAVVCLLTIDEPARAALTRWRRRVRPRPATAVG